jgi:peroxiredoxin
VRILPVSLLALLALPLGWIALGPTGTPASAPALAALPATLPGAVAPQSGVVVDDFACLDHAGRFQRLSRYADAKLVVLYAFADDCPIVRHDASELGGLITAFEPRGVRFLGLDPAPHDTRAGVAEELAELELALPVLMDETQCVAEMLGLTRTAEALVISTGDWRLRWRGPLTDRLGYGTQKDAATRSFLRETLEALLTDGSPPADAPAAKGCAFTFLAPRAADVPSYADDVAPILARRCVSCHTEGGIGPWSMNSYEKVRGWSKMTRQVLLEWRMPPWYADPAHGDFVEDIGIRPEEKRTLLHWIENGAPRGEGDDPLAATPEVVDEWPLGPPDLVIELDEQHIPATGLVPYRKIPYTLDLPEDRWVRAIDLRPSNPVVLHHAFGFVLGQQELETLLDELSELPEPVRIEAEKWLAEHGPDASKLPPDAVAYLRKRAFFGRTYFARYFPGTRSSEQREGGSRRLIDAFPEGTGKRLPANAELLFELHYTSVGKPATDRPRLGLYFHDQKPARELKVTSAFTRKVGMEPHESDKHLSAEKVFDQAFVLYAVSPHMHYRGRSMRYTAHLPDGTSEVLINVAEYVFDWQANYTFREPRAFPAGTRIVCDAVYDNSRRNEYNPNPDARVTFGPKSQDEMFVAYMVYALQ